MRQVLLSSSFYKDSEGKGVRSAIEFIKCWSLDSNSGSLTPEYVSFNNEHIFGTRCCVRA